MVRPTHSGPKRARRAGQWRLQVASFVMALCVLTSGPVSAVRLVGTPYRTGYRMVDEPSKVFYNHSVVVQCSNRDMPIDYMAAAETFKLVSSTNLIPEEVEISCSPIQYNYESELIGWAPVGGRMALVLACKTTSSRDSQSQVDDALLAFAEATGNSQRRVDGKDVVIGVALAGAGVAAVVAAPIAIGALLLVAVSCMFACPDDDDGGGGFDPAALEGLGTAIETLNTAADHRIEATNVWRRQAAKNDENLQGEIETVAAVVNETLKLATANRDQTVRMGEFVMDNFQAIEDRFASTNDDINLLARDTLELAVQQEALTTGVASLTEFTIEGFNQTDTNIANLRASVLRELQRQRSTTDALTGQIVAVAAALRDSLESRTLRSTLLRLMPQILVQSWTLGQRKPFAEFQPEPPSVTAAGADTSVVIERAVLLYWDEYTGVYIRHSLTFRVNARYMVDKSPPWVGFDSIIDMFGRNCDGGSSVGTCDLHATHTVSTCPRDGSATSDPYNSTHDDLKLFCAPGSMIEVPSSPVRTYEQLRTVLTVGMCASDKNVGAVSYNLYLTRTNLHFPGILQTNASCTSTPRQHHENTRVAPSVQSRLFEVLPISFSKLKAQIPLLEKLIYGTLPSDMSFVDSPLTRRDATGPYQQCTFVGCMTYAEEDWKPVYRYTRFDVRGAVRTLFRGENSIVVGGGVEGTASATSVVAPDDGLFPLTFLSIGGFLGSTAGSTYTGTRTSNMPFLDVPSDMISDSQFAAARAGTATYAMVRNSENHTVQQWKAENGNMPFNHFDAAVEPGYYERDVDTPVTYSSGGKLTSWIRRCEGVAPGGDVGILCPMLGASSVADWYPGGAGVNFRVTPTRHSFTLPVSFVDGDVISVLSDECPSVSEPVVLFNRGVQLTLTNLQEPTIRVQVDRCGTSTSRTIQGKGQTTILFPFGLCSDLSVSVLKSDSTVLQCGATRSLAAAMAESRADPTAYQGLVTPSFTRFAVETVQDTSSLAMANVVQGIIQLTLDGMKMTTELALMTTSLTEEQKAKMREQIAGLVNSSKELTKRVKQRNENITDPDDDFRISDGDEFRAGLEEYQNATDLFIDEATAGLDDLVDGFDNISAQIEMFMQGAIALHLLEVAEQEAQNAALLAVKNAFDTYEPGQGGMILAIVAIVVACVALVLGIMACCLAKRNAPAHAGPIIVTQPQAPVPTPVGVQQRYEQFTPLDGHRSTRPPGVPPLM